MGHKLHRATKSFMESTGCGVRLLATTGVDPRDNQSLYVSKLRVSSSSQVNKDGYRSALKRIGHKHVHIFRERNWITRVSAWAIPSNTICMGESVRHEYGLISGTSELFHVSPHAPRHSICGRECLSVYVREWYSVCARVWQNPASLSDAAATTRGSIQDLLLWLHLPGLAAWILAAHCRANIERV